MPKVMEGVSKERSDIHEVIIMLVIQIRKKVHNHSKRNDLHEKCNLRNY